jgi:hypothetical protein
MHLILMPIPGTQDFKLRLTDRPGVAEKVDITVQVSSTELKYVVQALLLLVPPTAQEQLAIGQWFNRVP